MRQAIGCMATLLRVKPVSTFGSQAVSLLIEYEVTAGGMR